MQENKTLKSVPTPKKIKTKFITVCEWCKKEKIGKAGKYHKWCSYDVKTLQLREYQKKHAT